MNPILSSRLAGLLSFTFVILSSPLYAQTSGNVSPSDLEAAYLYNFGKFVSWPAPSEPSSAFLICTLGKDEFGPTLDSLVANETMQGRKIMVRRLSSISEADECQILFLGLSEEARLTKDLQAVRQKPVLTVSSLPGFLDRGGMIQFILQNKRLRFAVNLVPAEQSHLAFSSELLKVAIYVTGSHAEVRNP